jgi:hypothetical protein
VVRAVVVLLWLQSLYMLKIVRWPCLPEKRAAEMSLEGICSWVYASVQMLVLIKRMDLEVDESEERCGEG